MELFAPDGLPGVGMGTLEAVAAICGLLGLAVTSGALVAQGLLGTILFIVSALAVLGEKPDLGGSVPLTSAVLVAIALLTLGRVLVERRAAAAATKVTGAAKDDPATKALQATVDAGERWARRLAILAVSLAGAAVGIAWAEWNEVPFRLEDTEAFVGLGIGLVAAGIGGDAAWRFIHGAVRAGGSAIVVGASVCIAAYLLNATSVYVPFVGAVVFVLATVLAVRLRRREQQKYAGLRILS